MHAAQFGDQGSKFGKIAIVAGLHLAFAIAALNMKIVVPPEKPGPTIAVPPLPLPPPPIRTDPDLTTRTKPPEIVVPFTEIVDIKQDDVVSRKIEEKSEPTVPGETVVQGKKDDGGAGAGGGTGDIKKEKVFVAALANAKDCALPDYPATAARNGYTGTVSLALLIGANGEVSDSRVQKSSGHRELDRAAIDALRMCKFKPATSNGVAEPAWGQIAYVWRLD
ncbi:energy transducer TonB [Massilia sp. CF038]|uniref:energy transducer TonB n=1 Tax=Massilia sp. CF038 TaxID=1881045 RepID=UPI00091B81D5|nr:energy transducer TonB [Massilia sp. CF038]SHH69858.1 protein TonB [Massilia sp. CF038]